MDIDDSVEIERKIDNNHNNFNIHNPNLKPSSIAIPNHNSISNDKTNSDFNSFLQSNGNKNPTAIEERNPMENFTLNSSVNFPPSQSVSQPDVNLNLSEELESYSISDDIPMVDLSNISSKRDKEITNFIMDFISSRHLLTRDKINMRAILLEFDNESYAKNIKLSNQELQKRFKIILKSLLKDKEKLEM
jgi:hypothetical protein